MVNESDVWAKRRPGNSPVLYRLARLASITEDDRKLLAVALKGLRFIAANTDLVRQAEAPGSIRFIHRGFACRYATLADGRRQITDLLVAGDFFVTDSPFFATSDYNICTLTPAVLSEVPQHTAAALMNDSPAIAEAFKRANVVTEARLREQVINLGRRSAKERLAHLFCEMYERSRSVGLATGFQYSLPLSQSDFADILGLSLVHTNRSLQALRAEKLVMLKARLLTILDFDRLQALAGFNSRYLDPDSKLAASAQSGPVPADQDRGWDLPKRVQHGAGLNYTMEAYPGG